MDRTNHLSRTVVAENGPAFPRLTDSQWQRIADALKLTPREQDVVAVLLRGGQDKEIASELGISVHTVHSLFDRIYRKTQVAGRCELILRVFASCVAQKDFDMNVVPGNPPSIEKHPFSNGLR